MASWKPVFDAILDLYDDISTLMRDLDYQLDRHGYACIHPQHYGFEGTAALDRPRGWLPTWMCRLYARQSEQAPRRFLSLGVLLHPEGVEVLNPNWPDPQSPIILGSVVRYREPPGDGWDLRHGLLWLQSDAPLDGTVHRVVPPEPPPPAPSAPVAAPPPPGKAGAKPAPVPPQPATPPRPVTPRVSIEYADVMALPLEAVRTGEDLRGLLIDPLRRLI